MDITIKQFRDKGGKPIAGMTPEHAVYDSDGKRLDGKMEEIMSDGWVEEKRLSRDSVVTEKIKDGNVTMRKLSVEVQGLIEAGTGVDASLLESMEEWNDRIAALESDKLNPKTVVEADGITEYSTGVQVGILAYLSTDSGRVDSDEDWTDKVLTVNYGGDETVVHSGTYSGSHVFTRPSSLTITASGTAKYKGVDVTFPKVTRTVYAVGASYMGYVESLDNITDAAIEGLQKNVKHSLSGSYNITNGYTSAYFIVAVPKDGAVNGISRIVQHGLMDAEQTIGRHDTSNYNVYVCSTAHNKGTYNFIIS